MQKWILVLQVGILLCSIALSSQSNGWGKDSNKGSGRRGQKHGSGKSAGSSKSSRQKGRQAEQGSGSGPAQSSPNEPSLAVMPDDYQDPSQVFSKSPAPKHDFPFIVTIDKWDGTKKEWVPQGSGSIFNPWTIFIAGTLYNKIKNFIENRDLRIGAGSHDLGQFENTRQYRQPCSGDVHPGYSGQVNNLAVLHLSEAFRFNKYVSNIPIPKTDVRVTGVCRFGGWGAADGITKGPLQQTQATIASSCSPADPSIMCTSSATCKGDEGSPLVCTQDNRMFAYGIAIDAGPTCGTGNSNFFLTTKLDRNWLNTTLEAGRNKCRTYYKF